MPGNKTFLTKPKQFALFELIEPQDLGYSHFVDFYDHIPMFIDSGRKRYVNYADGKESLSTSFRFAKAGQQEKTFYVTLKPGRIKTKDNKEVLVYPSIQREEPVYDALRKLSTSGSGVFVDEQLGTYFTLSMLQKELKKFGRTFSLDEIKESLKVLKSAEIEIVSSDRTFELFPNYLSMMALKSRSHYEDKEVDSKCIVSFDALVTDSVNNLEFREFNYAIAQSTKHAIARYLIKRMDRRYKQAAPDKPFSIKLTTIFSMVYRELDKKMGNNTRHMDNAIKIMKEQRRIKHVNIEPIKSESSSSKIIDYRYEFYPHEELIADMKRFNAKKRDLTHQKKLSEL